MKGHKCHLNAITWWCHWWQMANYPGCDYQNNLNHVSHFSDKWCLIKLLYSSIAMDMDTIYYNKIPLEVHCWVFPYRLLRMFRVTDYMNIHLIGLDQSELCNCAMKHWLQECHQFFSWRFKYNVITFHFIFTMQVSPTIKDQTEGELHNYNWLGFS